MANADARLLTGRRIDPGDPRPPLVQALRIGLYDEWHALTFYDAVVRRFGPVQPFSNIRQSEAMHAQILSELCRRYGVPLPVNDWPNRVRLPSTLAACCAEGMAGEIENVAMYGRFLAYPMPPDVAAAFRRLQAASGQRHLPAFRRCAGAAEVAMGGASGTTGLPVMLAAAGVAAVGFGALRAWLGSSRRRA